MYLFKLIQERTTSQNKINPIQTKQIQAKPNQVITQVTCMYLFQLLF